MIKKHSYPFAVLFFLCLTSANAFQVEPSVRIMIPKGMPMTIDFHRDQNEPQILKYVFTRHAKDALSARITIAMLDQTGSVKFARTREGTDLSDPMTVATVDPSVAQILLVVERLETQKGKWILDTKVKELDLRSLAKNGISALPKATFIPKH